MRKKTVPSRRKRTVETPNHLGRIDPSDLAAAQGVGPMTLEKLRAMGDVWPEDESIDEFVSWVRERRREGG